MEPPYLFAYATINLTSRLEQVKGRSGPGPELAVSTGPGSANGTLVGTSASRCDAGIRGGSAIGGELRGCYLRDNAAAAATGLPDAHDPVVSGV